MGDYPRTPQECSFFHLLAFAHTHIEPSKLPKEQLSTGFEHPRNLAGEGPAPRQEEVAGHIAFSEVEISDQTAGWFGLGPLSVVKRWRCRGIGTTLVREGLERLRNLGANGCFVLGDPRFYGRFGFVNDPHLLIEGVPQEFCLSLPFTGKRASGVVTYHRIFYTSC